MTPYRPLRQCAHPGCGLLVPKGRCILHRRQAELERGSPSARGYGRAHQAMRARVMREEPNCRICGAEWVEGQPEHHADHIIPTSQGGSDERENYQRLCASCNSRKAKEDRR